MENGGYRCHHLAPAHRSATREEAERNKPFLDARGLNGFHLLRFRVDTWSASVLVNLMQAAGIIPF